jgi:uracil-DNA glycosylase family 4
MSGDPREELAAVAASLRAYLEWQADTGAMGIPRRPRGAARAEPAMEADAAPEPERAPPPARKREIGAPMPPELFQTPAPPAVAPATKAQSSADAPKPKKSAAPARALPVIEAEVKACTKCALHEGRTNTVFARGNPDAKLCFVGEAPGADEDAQGLPFVGRAGQLLDKMIHAMGLDPAQDVYVCNIVKCRPPGNRRPEPDEVAACIPYLHEQLATLAPKVIVALGNTAVSSLLGTTLGITKVRGSWKLYRGTVPVMPTYHPSYLLRPSAQQVEAKRQAWDDLQAVMKELGLALPKKS